jgi:Fe-S-cluster-containing hydrogenase component 2
MGCGLCTVACDQAAIQMQANPAFRQRPETIASTLLQIGRNYVRNAWSVWREGR